MHCIYIVIIISYVALGVIVAVEIWNLIDGGIDSWTKKPAFGKWFFHAEDVRFMEII